MLKDPSNKYVPLPPLVLAGRQWPDKILTAPPIWMSTDLRDGNQALFEPMDVARKLLMFKTLCEAGFRQIEVAFPSASKSDFNFVRELVDGNHIPAGVAIEVLTHAREPLIRRTVESLKGAACAIVHVVNATSKPFREIVLGKSMAEVRDMAVDAVHLVRRLTEELPQTDALEVSNAVTEAWGATQDNKVIINLPTSVEMTTPNVYADQIEWMHRRLARRDSIVLSIHPHNDRGTAVASAELALMAGADRVEGCLFGNGERTGNVDIVTLALNLYTQGIAPGLDFSDINQVARTVERCTGLAIPPRHPYVGDLVFTAFSGSHQDAISKGLALQRADDLWCVPYLPIDPSDLGRSFDSVIRVNSQSGKGGIAYLLETEYGIVLPRRLQIEFAVVVQRHVDRQGGELSATDIWKLFCLTYLEVDKPVCYIEYHTFDMNEVQGIRLGVEIDGVRQTLEGFGNGPIDAAVNALRNIGINLQVRSFEERSRGSSVRGGDAVACAFIEMAGSGTECYGAAMDANIVTASIKALIVGVNRLGCDVECAA